jgi:hypothetical protein
MREWAVQLPKQDAHTASRLRDCSGVVALELDASIWLRGPYAEDTPLRIAALPGQRYDVLDDGQLILHGNRVPSARLPKGDWILLTSFVQLSLPTARYASGSIVPVPLRLERTDENQSEAGALLVQSHHWLAFINTAPAIRLAPLRFAVASDDRVLVIGQPLPSLPGTYLSFTNNIAIPTGFRWQPAVEPPIARSVFGGEPEAVVLWTTTDDWERIPADAITTVTRAAVRATMAMER